jgi:hypothetical protein
LVDETCTHVEIDGEIVKTYAGDLVLLQTEMEFSAVLVILRAA